MRRDYIANAAPLPEINLGNYYALVIGNNNYANLPNLDAAVSDAREAAKLLEKRYGFKTKLLLNATRYEILSALNELRSRLTEADNLLIYYAGHGELDRSNTRGYWLPVDAEQENPANWISNTAITDFVNVIQAKHVMVIADSCYSGTLSQSAIVRPEVDISPVRQRQWIDIIKNVRSRTVLTSGGLEPVQDSAGGNHSVFASAFLESLRDNNTVIEGYSLYRSIAEKMARNEATLTLQQTPAYSPIQHSGHEAGDFLFQPVTI